MEGLASGSTLTPKVWIGPLARVSVAQDVQSGVVGAWEPVKNFHGSPPDRAMAALWRGRTAVSGREAGKGQGEGAAGVGTAEEGCNCTGRCKGRWEPPAMVGAAENGLHLRVQPIEI